MLYCSCSWDMSCEGCNCYFSFWVIFYPFTHLTAQNIKFLKNEKKAWRYHLFTHVHQKFRSDNVVPEIWSATYGWKKWHIEVGATPKNTWRYHYFTQVYQKSQWYHLQFLKYRAWQTKICNFRSFCALLPRITLKTKILKKWKKWLKIFYTCTKNRIHRCVVPEIQSETDRIFSRFGAFFALSPHYESAKSKFGKNEKNTWRYYWFTTVHHKWQLYISCMISEIWSVMKGIFCHVRPIFALLSH